MVVSGANGGRGGGGGSDFLNEGSWRGGLGDLDMWHRQGSLATMTITSIIGSTIHLRSRAPHCGPALLLLLLFAPVLFGELWCCFP